MCIRNGILILLAVLSFTACKKNSEDVLFPQQPPSQPAPLPATPASLVLKAITQPISTEIGGYYRALPSDYDSTKEDYPVIIFLHGAGQLGNGKGQLQRLLYFGTLKYIQDSIIPASFDFQNKQFSFLYLAPQFKTTFSVPDLDQFITYVSSHYKINKSRIYLLGLSMGGRLACSYAARYPEKIAAVASMAGGMRDDAYRPEKAANIASHNVAVWAIHNNQDLMVDTENSTTMVTLLKQSNPEMEARLTLLSPMGTKNHDAWTRACKLDFKEDGKNVYEWFLQYTK
jgi:predicted peptidase